MSKLGSVFWFGLCAYLLPCAALADSATVHLNNGGLVAGEVLLFIPGDKITLQIHDGSTYTALDADIAEVRLKDPSATEATTDAPAAQKTAPASPAVPSAAPHPAGPGAACAPSPPQPCEPAAPSLATPLALLVPGTLTLAVGGALIAAGRPLYDEEYDDYYGRDEPLIKAGASLVAAGSGLVAGGFAFLIVRIVKRSRWQRHHDEVASARLSGMPALGRDAGGARLLGARLRVTF